MLTGKIRFREQKRWFSKSSLVLHIKHFVMQQLKTWKKFTYI